MAGTWKDLTDNVNFMAGNLTGQVRNIAEVTTAVANGDLSQEDHRRREGRDPRAEEHHQHDGRPAQLVRLGGDARGARGRHRGQARRPGRRCKGVAGTWKDLTDNVNFMAGNLTNQVRGIAKVVTAVANGDLKQKLTVEAKGEIAALADTINSMIDTLATFADQVTTVAREVGVEGKLGGQASVPGAAGTWKRPDRQRQPARRQPDHAGARHRRGGHRRDQGRPDAVDHGRGAGRGRGAQGQHQRDDPQPARTRR